MDYSYIIIPIIVGITSQALKLITDGVKGNLDIKNMFESYGGMPSTHTAFSVSITTLIGLKLGFDSAVFGAALVFTVLIMRDAASFRNILGRQAIIINKFIKALPANEKKNISFFKERIGHTYLEVGAGAILGIGLTYILSLI